MDIESPISPVYTARPATSRSEPIATDSEVLGFESLSVGGAFDAAFELYKRHFPTIALIVACVFIPTQVLLHAAGNVWMRPLIAHFNPDNPDVLGLTNIIVLGLLVGAPQYGVPGFLSLLTSFMVSGPVAVAVANILVGKPLSVGAAYQRAVPMFWRLFWIWTLFFLIYVLAVVITLVLVFILLMIAATIPFLQGFVTAGGPELGLAFVLFLAVVPYLICCLIGTAFFAFSPPVISLENVSVLGAVERNLSLVSGRLFRRTLLTLSLLPILVFGLQYLMLLSASSVVEAFKWPAWAYFVVNTGLASIVNFFFQPYWMVLITLLYFDCRVRREGLDVRFMADNLSSLDPYLDPNAAPGTTELPPTAPARATAGSPVPQSMAVPPPPPMNERDSF